MIHEDDEIPYWERPRDIRGEAITRLYSELSGGVGTVLCDQNFVSAVLPHIISNTVDFVIEHSLVRYYMLFVIMLNFALNWSLGQVLGRIWLPFAYVYHAYCFASCFMGEEVRCFGIISLVLFLRELMFGYRGKKDEVVPVIRYLPAPQRSRNIDWMMVLAILLAVFAWGADMYGLPAQPLYITAMIMLFWSFTVSAPNAGGNSIWANVPYFMMFLLVLLLLEPFRKFVSTAMEERGALLEAVEQRRIDFSSGYALWSVIKEFDFLGPYFSTIGGSGFGKAVIGAFLQSFIVIDTMFGPGNMLKGLVKVDRLSVTTFLAGVFSHSLIGWVVLEISVHVMIGGWEKVVSIVIGTLFAGVIWYLIMPALWETKGTAATAVKVRTNFLMHFGDGATGMRKLILKFAIVMCWLMESVKGFSLLTLGSTIFALSNEKAGVYVVGHLSGSIVMILYQFFNGEFLTGDLNQGAPGVQRGDAGNVGAEGVQVGENALNVFEHTSADDWLPIPSNPILLDFMGRCRINSTQPVDKLTLQKLRKWASRTGGEYRVLCAEPIGKTETAIESDDGRQIIYGPSVIGSWASGMKKNKRKPYSITPEPRDGIVPFGVIPVFTEETQKVCDKRHRQTGVGEGTQGEASVPETTGKRG